MRLVDDLNNIVRDMLLVRLHVVYMMCYSLLIRLLNRFGLFSP